LNNTQFEADATVIAWSGAGLFAITLAHQFKNLILLNSSPKLIADDDWAGITREQFSQLITFAATEPMKFKKKFAWLCAYPNVDKYLDIIEYLDVSPQQIELARSIMDMDVRQPFKSLTNIKVISADNDAVVKVDTNALTQLNPNTRIEILKKAGHACFITHELLI